MLRRLGSVAVTVASVVALTGMASVPGGEHCAVRLVPLDSGAGPQRAARLQEVGCYRSFAEAVAAGSGGAIRLHPRSSPAALTQAQLDLATPSRSASVMIGTEYTSTSYNGSSKSYFASVTCSPSTTWQVSYVTDEWNDDFESGKGFGNCDLNRKFAASNFGGASIACTPNCADYGSLRNLVSSLRWRD